METCVGLADMIDAVNLLTLQDWFIVASNNTMTFVNPEDKVFVWDWVVSAGQFCLNAAHMV